MEASELKSLRRKGPLRGKKFYRLKVGTPQRKGPKLKEEGRLQKLEEDSDGNVSVTRCLRTGEKKGLLQYTGNKGFT